MAWHEASPPGITNDESLHNKDNLFSFLDIYHTSQINMSIFDYGALTRIVMAVSVLRCLHATLCI